MKTSNKKVILITGVSSGIGAVCAELLSKSGYTVYGTSRKTQPSHGQFEVVKMDVTDEESIQSAIQYVIGKEKRIDILINNAGIGIAGPLENSSMEEIQLQFDVNFFGVVRMCKAVIPIMKAQQGGTIINVSSLGGILGMPFQAYYAAAKFAIEGFSESMHMELKRFKIKTVLIEPGDIKTNFTDNRIIVKNAQGKDPDLDAFNNALKVIVNDETHGADPVMVARLILKIISKKNPGLRYPATSFEQGLVPILRRLLPYSLFEKIIASHYGV